MNNSTEENERNYSSGEIRLELDHIGSINHVILTAFGLPLNLLIVIVILTTQKLKNKTRNVIFLGVSLSAVFTLLTILVELLAYHAQSFFLCKVFGLSTGVAYSSLLYNLTLALLDRYWAIVSPLLHRKMVCVKNVLVIQTMGTVIIFFLYKWQYVFGVVPLQCGFVLIEGKTTAVTNAVLISLIVILNIVVYVKTKYYTRPDRTVSISFVNNHQAINPSEFQDEPQQAAVHFAPMNAGDGTNNNNSSSLQQGRSEPIPQTPSAPTRVNNINISSPLQIHGGNRRMEIEATFTLLIGVSSLLIFTSPMLIISSLEMGCLWIFDGADQEEEHCSKIFDVSLPYCREFLLYHLVYNPVMYMIRSKEFASTLTEKLARTHRRRQNRSEIRNLRINATTMTRLPRSFQLTNVP